MRDVLRSAGQPQRSREIRPSCGLVCKRVRRCSAWNAGAIAYLSGRTVVNLDGLVNSSAEAPPADAPRPCADRLEPIWAGPGYPSRPDRRAAAYRIRRDAP